jgi:hypothetical protein
MEKKDSPAVVVTPAAEKVIPKPVQKPAPIPEPKNERIAIKVSRAPTTKKNTDDTIADMIWNAIKDKPIDVFALPNQIVSDYFTPVAIEPSRLYLSLSAPAAFPALETALGKSYVVDQDQKFVIVTLPK